MFRFQLVNIELWEKLSRKINNLYLKNHWKDIFWIHTCFLLPLFSHRFFFYFFFLNCLQAFSTSSFSTTFFYHLFPHPLLPFLLLLFISPLQLLLLRFFTLPLLLLPPVPSLLHLPLLLSLFSLNGNNWKTFSNDFTIRSLTFIDLFYFLYVPARVMILYIISIQ